MSNDFEKWLREYDSDQSLTLAAEFPYYASYVTCMIASAWQARQPEIDALKAENERLRKDAKRYRWIRANIGAFSNIIEIYRADIGWDFATTEECDSNVDAAMSALPENEGE